jgi:TonB-linked SusC/RagA family outer membrane protein
MAASFLSDARRALALAVLTLVATAGASWAQAGRIGGTVTTRDGAAPVPGARVTVVGTALNATTDERGFYSIPNVPAGTYSVRVVAVGFQSVLITNQSVTPGGAATADFTLPPSVFRMDDVVVTGVAEQTRGVKLPFVVEKVSMEDIPVPSRNAVETLQGKMAGVHVVRGNGTPGGGISVQLRGAASINTEGRSTEPLYVVDGVILSESMVDIDALDIQSIEVVKGAAGAALYGARAGNGVIVIQTNRGRMEPEGQTRVTFRSEFGRNDLSKTIQQAQSHFYLQDANGNWIMSQTGQPDTTVSPNDRALATRRGWGMRRDFVRDSTQNTSGAWVRHQYAISDNPYTGATYDNLDLFFNPGTFYTNTGSIAHRTGNTNFLASFSETREQGVVDGLDGYKRRGGRVNVDHRLAGQLDFSASAYYSQSLADDPQGGENAFYGLNFYPIDVNLLELNPAPRDSNDFLINPDAQVVEANPIYSARNNDEQHRRSRFLGNVRARWRPTTIFDVEADFSVDRADRNRTFYFFKGFRTVDAPFEDPGLLRKDNLTDQSINASLTAALTKSFGGFNTVTKARALIERADENFFEAEANELVVGSVEDLDAANPNLNQITSSNEAIRSAGYFLSTQVDFQDKYIVDALIRRDGSSLFGAAERWQWYYRLSGAYRLSEEPWWPLGGVFSEFKLRASQGTAGGRPRFSAQYETYDLDQGAVEKATLGNRDLRPEFSKETELGTDMIAWGRLALGVTYAKSVVKDQLLLVPLPGYVGFANQWRNAGTLESKTWEASLEASLVQGRDFNWNMSLVGDRTRQVISEFDLPAQVQDGIYYIRPGERLGTMYGHRWATTCGEVFSPTAGFGQNCDQFAVNDDGYLVAVGSGNTWTDGIDKNLYGSTISIGGVNYAWGLPFYAQEVVTDPATGQLDTSNFLPMGNTFPDINLGWSNTINFKGLTVYTLFDGSFGGEVYNNTRQWPARELNAWEVDQSGKPENQKKTIDYYTRLYDVNADNSHYVEDGSFVKFRELQVRYAFDVGGTGLFGGLVQRVAVSLIGRNLHTWTDYSGYDPEVTLNATSPVWKRYDAFDYPSFRSITGSIELEF